MTGSSAPKQHWTLESLTSLFKAFPLLERFPQNIIAELARSCDVIDYLPNTEILKQGALNEHLYFLVSGQVGVYVDGGRVSKLQRRGDLLGEMSVISGKKVGATILAETPVTVVRVDSKIFLNMAGPERDAYLSILYRIYATVLADKLNETNQKAKHFEELSVQLTATQAELEEANHNLERKVEERTQRLEQQNAELLASKNKTEDLLNTKRVLIHKLSELQRDSLNPLKGFLDDIRKRFPTEKVVDDARRLVFDVQNLLTPLTVQFSSEQAVQGKRVLLADPHKKQQIIAKMALGGTGVVLDIVSTIEEGQEKLAGPSYDLILFDASMYEVGNLAHAKNPNVGLVLMTSDQVPNYLPHLHRMTFVPHIVSRDEMDRTFTVKNIMTTVTKLLSRDVFGLEKYVSWGVDIQNRTIISSRQRVDLLTDMDHYLENLGVRRVNRDRIRTVAEEMLMNAIYDAPVDNHGRSMYNYLQRTEDVTLRPEEQGILRYATDGMLIAVSVQDPFGSLKGSTILHYLEHNYAGKASEVHGSEAKGGGGRGLHQIVECSDLVVFNIQFSQRTEVIALFNVEVKERAHQNPSFHLFIS